jgi:hypothetical protein
MGHFGAYLMLWGSVFITVYLYIFFIIIIYIVIIQGELTKRILRFIRGEL